MLLWSWRRASGPFAAGSPLPLGARVSASGGGGAWALAASRRAMFARRRRPRRRTVAEGQGLAGASFSSSATVCGAASSRVRSGKGEWWAGGDGLAGGLGVGRGRVACRGRGLLIRDSNCLATELPCGH